MDCSTEKGKTNKGRNKILNIENAVMKEYYNTLEYQLERTRKFRHDIEKHMNVISELILNKNEQKNSDIKKRRRRYNGS